MGFKSFNFQREAGHFEFLLIWVIVTGAYTDCVLASPNHFAVGFFLFFLF